jgi:hypothetical protein
LASAGSPAEALDFLIAGSVSLMASREHLARALWTLFEPIHAVGYFSTEARGAFADVGLKRFWDGYFAGRAAPLGAVGAGPITAIFSGFAPSIVARTVPAVWDIASPAVALEARSAGAAATLRAYFGDERAVADAASALTGVALGADTICRPLAAANVAMPLDDDPYRQLWQAATTLREHRGDGHVVALVNEEIAGLSTIVLRSAIDLDGPAMLKARGWTQEEWDAETASLVERGLLAADHSITGAGTAAIDRAEATTNRLAVGPWQHLSDGELLGVARLLAPIAGSFGGLYPQPNPIGMPQPWNPDTDPDALDIPAAPTLETDV